ncbi:putative membrane protein YesL [Evansella vedderi]|uniref:Membrane protein YesL n=1 Tax=Evansella vedderi TaxID=38282 RepID=A0ABU0A0P9_9BACI|nr:DUF624 domain-containing protein [Evansella vedderi]MDQ0257057.1 putative membrane protein YesL [Evansella vedderi]
MFGTQWYIRLGNWGFNLLLLNILWVLFSCIGLIIVGIFPATAALFAVLRELIMEDADTPVFKLFWSKFKAEFIQSNILGYIVILVGVVLYVDLRVLHQLDSGLLQLTLASITVVIGFAYLLILLYIFPVFVHFNLKLWQYPKHALILAIGRPFHTITLFAGIAIIILIYLAVPALIFAIGMSLISFIMMKVASMSLPRKNIAF